MSKLQRLKDKYFMLSDLFGCMSVPIDASQTLYIQELLAPVFIGLKIN